MHRPRQRIADGLTDTRSAKARSILPGGAVLWAWDADPEFDEKAGEMWLTLLPSKWNPMKPIVYGWRYDPRELGAAQAPATDARRKNICVALSRTMHVMHDLKRYTYMCTYMYM